MPDKTSSESKKRRTPYKTTVKRAKTAGILCLVLVAVLLFMMSPVFSIKNISVEGNIKLSEADIIKASGISKGDNIFSVNAAKAEKGVTSLGRVASLRLIRSLPSKLTLSVDEKTECGYIKEKGAYTAIDETGRIIVTSSAIEEKAPVINGIKTIDSKKGQFIKIDADNAKELSSLITRMLTELKSGGILSDIKSIDISNLSDIRMTLVNDTLVNMGADGEEDGDSIEYKIAYLKAIIPELPASQNGGVIELSDTENVTSRMS